MAQFINSSDIMMYPTEKRDDRFDRNARLPVEQYLVSFINRLNNRKGFVIEGLEIQTNKILPGSCSINGYLFTLKEDINIIETSSGSKTTLYLKLKTLKEDNFEELIAFDTEEYESGLDSSMSFKGLQIEADEDNIDLISPNIDNTLITYSLPLAKWDTDKWVTLFVEDGHLGNRPNMLKLMLTDIGVPANSYYLHPNARVPQDLYTFLAYNYEIDDGEVQ